MNTKVRHTPLEVMIDERNLRIVRVDEKAIGIRDLEFIVRAVNSHADMLEALEAMLAAYAPNADWSKPEELHGAVRKAGAAIAKARGDEVFIRGVEPITFDPDAVPARRVEYTKEQIAKLYPQKESK